MFISYWLILVKRNKGLEKESTKMTISVESFKHELKKAFDAGVEYQKSKDTNVNYIDLFMEFFK